MADDLNDLGSAAIWRIADHLEAIPDYDFEWSIAYQEFPGSAHELVEISALRPQTHGFTAVFTTKAEENEFLENFATHKGRHKRFWFPSSLDLFTLSGLHGSGSIALTVISNSYELTPGERVYILIDNGDILTHEITSIAVDEEDQETTLYLAGTTDRIINPVNVERFGVLMLARLDIDEIVIKHRNAQTSTSTIRITELPLELNEV